MYCHLCCVFYKYLSKYALVFDWSRYYIYHIWTNPRRLGFHSLLYVNKMYKNTKHWRRSHYTVTNVRNKNSNVQGRSKSDFPYHKDLLLKGKNSLHLGAKFSFKRSSHFVKGRNWRESLIDHSSLPLMCVTFSAFWMRHCQINLSWNPNDKDVKVHLSTYKYMLGFKTIFPAVSIFVDFMFYVAKITNNMDPKGAVWSEYITFTSMRKSSLKCTICATRVKTDIS